ncbi:MAG: FtsW/RodA/SpoVE family cell cycle protein [Bacteroidaceae bacterium]|nr:FtsW/RodA/SpoVE family cell cycle protein [Bacteroidaceae bacterium]
MKLTQIFKGDGPIWAVFFFLSLISIVEIFSSASQLSYKTGNFYSPLIRQVGFVFIGFVIISLISRIPCRFFKVLPIIMLPFSWFFLLYTLLFAKAVNDGARWVEIGGISFQPSEIAKLSLIIYTAFILSAHQREDGVNGTTFKWIMFPTVVTCGLIFTENFSTAVLLFGVILLMMFVGRLPIKIFGKMISFCVGVGILIFASVKVLPSSFVNDNSLLHRADTWVERISKFTEETSDDPKDYDFEANRQVANANIAIASSNIVGLMPGNSVQRDFLSQPFSDFIFAIIIEEMGIWGATIVVILYLVLIFRAWKIAARCKSNFPAFLMLGLSFMVVCQAMLNMMVAVGLFPVTGQPLPLISRGGTAFLLFSCYFGMMLSISASAKRREPEANLQMAAEG